MTLTALRDDGLASTDTGFTLRLGLPWIRSLPLSALTDLAITIDGDTAGALTIDLGGRRLSAATLGDEPDWWFLQDRIVVRGAGVPTPGEHVVAVSFRLVIPYLQAGQDSPLILPFAFERRLVTDAVAARPVILSLAERTSAAADPPGSGDSLPAGWTLAASAFNWTPDVIRADRSAADIAVGIVGDGVASVIELEPGQLWRGFPRSTDAETDALRDALDGVGGAVSIIGASLDDWLSATRRRTEPERLAFLLPQLRAAHRVGAAGVRLPIGQAGEPLLRQLLPTLQELDLALFEEIQGQQTPDSPAARDAIDSIARVDDPHVRVLVDISMLMPSLPPSYLELLRTGGVPKELLHRLETDWRDPSTNDAVVDVLRSGGVPSDVHTAFMNLLVRFGRSDASDLRDILPLVGAFHLKFWDLDDGDQRVSGPIRDLAAMLRGTGFSGSLCSEWGGHEWLDDDPTTMTRNHLALARRALNR